MNNYDLELQTALSLAKEAGAIMLQYFDVDQKVEFKTDNSPVTIADKLINSLVIKRLSEAFADDGVIGEEESTAEYGPGRKWICDPIDGTAGYVTGVPTSMFSLAFVEDGKPLVGVAYDPFLDKMYVGVAGQQSTCNGLPISVSTENLEKGKLGVHGNVSRLSQAPYFQKLIDDKLRLACYSGGVHKACLVARGKLVGFIEPGTTPHDMAAVHVILEGAGGTITGIDGNTLDYSKRFKGAIVSNGLVHDRLVGYMRTDIL